MGLERSTVGAAEHSTTPQQSVGATDTSSQRLQIMTTEHWSLLSARSLAYSESFSRASMFLTLLTGAVVALALVAQAADFGSGFMAFAIPVLAVVVFVGVATVARLQAINSEDLLWVAGMNRLRHAYLELQPDLDRYFVTASSDDFIGITRSLGMSLPAVTTRPSLASIAHGFVTVPGMLAVIVSVVAGALASTIAVAVGASMPIALLAGVFGFGVTAVGLAVYGYRSATGPPSMFITEFPTEAPDWRRRLIGDALAAGGSAGDVQDRSNVLRRERIKELARVGGRERRHGYAPPPGFLQDFGRHRQLAVMAGADDEPLAAPRDRLRGRQGRVAVLSTHRLRGTLVALADLAPVDDHVVLVAPTLDFDRPEGDQPHAHRTLAAAKVNPRRLEPAAPAAKRRS